MRSFIEHVALAKYNLLSLIKAGDAGSGTGMTVTMINILIERPFVDSHY